MVRKKLAALLVASLFSAGLALASAPYTDIADLSDRAAIDYLYDTQCLPFISGNNFEPQRLLTRGDLAQFIYYTAANIPLVPPNAPTSGQAPAADVMAAVSAAGILSGYQDGSFHPDETVTREQFASVIYRYLQYCRMAEADGPVVPYADANDIDSSYRTAVTVLQSKNLMVPADNYFRPKEGMTREAAAQVFYHLLHSDAEYTSHVQIETEVIKALNAEYGSVPLYFRSGTMYWDGDTLVLGIKGAPGRYLKDRLQKDVSKPGAVVLRKVSMSHTDYSQLMTQAIHCLVDNEGVQNYVGALPDYRREQIVLTVVHPVSEKTLAALARETGSGRVRLESMAVAGQKPSVQVVGKTAEEVAAEEKEENSREVRDLYSPILDDITTSTITDVQNEIIK